MLYAIEIAPDRLLRDRGGGDPLLGQIKATIGYHPTSAWGGPYGRVQARFHLSNAQLDPLLTRVASDFVLADPWGYLGQMLQRLSVMLTTGDATATGLVAWSEHQHALAGGAAALGVADYDAAANRAKAQTFDAATRWLQFGSYAWVFLALAAFGGSRYYGRSALLVVVILAITVVSAGTINDVVVRYRYPVMWSIYLLAMAGVAGLFGTLRVALAQWSRVKEARAMDHRPRATGGIWPTIRRGQLPLLGTLLVTVVVLAGLAAGRNAFAARPLAIQPPPTLDGSGPPLRARLDRLAEHLPAAQPVPRLVALGLPVPLSFDLIGPDGLVPDGQPDDPLLLTVGPEVQGQVLQFVELGSANKLIWDTTGWFEPLLVIRVDDGEYVSQHTDPRSQALELRPGDRFLVLASVPEQPVVPAWCSSLRLHLGNGIRLNYPVEPEPFMISPQHAAPAAHWPAQGCPSSPEPSQRERSTGSYRGVALGDREDNADIRAWIDRFGSLGHGAASYDEWISGAKPRDAAGQPRAFHHGVLLDAPETNEASVGCSAAVMDTLGAFFKLLGVRIKLRRAVA